MQDSSSPNHLLGVMTGIAVTVSGILLFVVICLRRGFSFSTAKLVSRKSPIDQEKVEAFVKNHESLGPKRYSYANVKRMTNSFHIKLGQGGYGSVFKGRLLNGESVAVKVLSTSKGSGEEFINEVASISKTSHVNIVTLVGFCFEGRRQALIYEYMPNGSLEKFIYNDDPSNASQHLGWEKLYHIAHGVARGLEYLHRGCKTRILHFDIKPHNILLDENFCPKITDFGLSKLCRPKESMVSMMEARGTLGYIAPEVFNRNFGGVSYKSDVYSFGMLLLEMVGGRKNLDPGVEHMSEIYFPQWVYKSLQLNLDLGLRNIVSEGDMEIVKKLLVVGLWCIQSNPSHRPAMGEVIDMLEGEIKELKFPPNPFFSSPPTPAR